MPRINISMKKRSLRSLPLVLPKYITEDDDGSEIEPGLAQVIDRSERRIRKKKPIRKVCRRYETEKEWDNSQDIPQSEEIMDNHFLWGDDAWPMNWKMIHQRDLKEQVANIDSACAE